MLRYSLLLIFFTHIVNGETLSDTQTQSDSSTTIKLSSSQPQPQSEPQTKSQSDSKITPTIAGDIASQLAAVSDNAMQQYGFMYDEASGYYYDQRTGLYYDQVAILNAFFTKPIYCGHRWDSLNCPDLRGVLISDVHSGTSLFQPHLDQQSGLD